MYFRVLGPVQVWDGETEIAVDGFKERTVLAALLLSRDRVVTDSRLLHLLWGERPPKTYAAQLYTYVSRLRKRFGDAVKIQRQHPGYILRVTSGELDADHFERLVRQGRELFAHGQHTRAAEVLDRALALWRGPALANVTDALAEADSGRLEEARTAALEIRIEVDMLLGRHDRLVSELTGLVNQYPLHERFRAQLMMALYRSNRQGDAMAAYHSGCRILAEELGVDPGPALFEAYQSILLGEQPRVAVRATTVGPPRTPGIHPVGIEATRRADAPIKRTMDRSPVTAPTVDLSDCPA